ncbi:Gfo/Idh/MocA family protein [Peristeroidobacter agariperforans]|uniref:Gfo/Idh/MocA family protein n=1 Tax=Peristeroidobacter agariperforans TaxID=268404 RepID=UPI00101D1511|nr:Gfo/Idh/MocA family oxidoreductase [Peristeroidobacter agariperforans]
MSPIKLAIVGLGKIARDQHLPSLAANPNYQLVAVASPHNKLEGTPSYPNIETMLREQPGIEAVSLCCTPQVRYEIANYALEQNKHVMLEKPPGATLNEVAGLMDLAQQRRLALFATWHSREAAAVEPARDWLIGRKIRKVQVTWKEDVRVWHPGQAWIWKAGGLGVFDPGINALSIITRILPQPLVLKDAELHVPSNCETPIAAELTLQGPGGLPVRAEFDFRQTGPQSWDIDIETDDGHLLLSKGGSVMHVDGKQTVSAPDREYANLYARFAPLVRERRMDVDLAAFRLVADAFMCGRRSVVDPFIE